MRGINQNNGGGCYSAHNMKELIKVTTGEGSGKCTLTVTHFEAEQAGAHTQAKQYKLNIAFCSQASEYAQENGFKAAFAEAENNTEWDSTPTTLTFNTAAEREAYTQGIANSAGYSEPFYELLEPTEAQPAHTQTKPAKAAAIQIDWDFVVRYYPDYDHADEIAHCDDLEVLYSEDGEVHPDSAKWQLREEIRAEALELGLPYSLLLKQRYDEAHTAVYAAALANYTKEYNALKLQLDSLPEVGSYEVAGYYKDNGTTFEDYIIKASHDVGNDDEDIFYYCGSLAEIKTLARLDNGADFVITYIAPNE